MSPVSRRLLITFVPAAAVLLLTAAISLFAHVDPSHLTQDVAAIANIPPLSGFLSSLGILAWCVAGSVASFVAFAGRGRLTRREFWFLLSSALLSAYLLFDDLFQFHEVLAPAFLGLSEKVLYALVALAALAYVAAFRKLILQTDLALLVLALVFLGGTLVIDAALQEWLLGRLGPWEYLLEDGAKWLGIAFWCGYCIHTSSQLLLLPGRAREA